MGVAIAPSVIAPKAAPLVGMGGKLNPHVIHMNASVDRRNDLNGSRFVFGKTRCHLFHRQGVPSVFEKVFIILFNRFREALKHQPHPIPGLERVIGEVGFRRVGVDIAEIDHIGIAVGIHIRKHQRAGLQVVLIVGIACHRGAIMMVCP